MNEKILRKNFIWGKGTRGYRIFKRTNILFLIAQVLYFLFTGAVTFIVFLTRNPIQDNKPNLLMSNAFTIVAVMFILLILINAAYVHQVCHRARIFSHNQGVLVGIVSNIGNKNTYCKNRNSDSRYVTIQTDRGIKDILVVDKNAYGRLRNAKIAIIVTDEGENWITYLKKC